jgi:hypothetical protein
VTWFKVDDKLHDHRKTRTAGKAAMGVWVLAGSWSADHLTDGFIPANVLSRWGTRADANRLVAAGLWHVDEHEGEKGWRFHQWDELQPTRAQKLAERAVRAEAGRAGGLRSGQARRAAKAKQGASAVVEPPTRPDPTNAAAAALAPLPPPLEILRSALEAHRLVVRWDRLSTDAAAEIERLIETHGDNALVRSAQQQFQPNKPAAFVQAWLPGWRDLRKPGDLALVEDDPCTQPGHSGTTRHCVQCASERKAAR